MPPKKTKPVTSPKESGKTKQRPDLALATKKEVAQLKRGICILAVGIHGIAQAVLSGAGKQEFSNWLVSELKKAGFEIKV